MEFFDKRVEEVEVYREGDFIRGVSGTYYIIINIKAVSPFKYGLLDLTSNTVRFKSDTIEDLVVSLERDENKTHIKNENVEVTFR